VALLLTLTVAMTTTRAAFINLTPDGPGNSDDSVPLSDLLGDDDTDDDGIIVGDKIISGFSYSRIGDMPEADDINVLGFQDQDGNWGLSFHGTFLDLPGGGISDALIRFIVDIDPEFLQAGWRINDAHLFLNGVGVGSPDSFFSVDESFAPDSNETLNVHASTFPNGTTVLSDSTDFVPPLTRLHVTKDILAIASSASGQPARATVIDQSFSQIVPEPTTLVLSLVSACALVVIRRNRNS
jgi:hypothetical protein